MKYKNVSDRGSGKIRLVKYGENGMSNAEKNHNNSDKSCDSKNKKPDPNRSNRMLELFNGIQGENLAQFPVPPFTKWLNGRILQAARGDIQVEFRVRPEMANPTGLLHGGMQSAMMDDVIGMACATLGYEGFLLSINLHVSYLGKVKVGDLVKVGAKLVREGNTISHAMAEIRNELGDLIALGESDLVKTTRTPDYNKEKPASS